MNYGLFIYVGVGVKVRPFNSFGSVQFNFNRFTNSIQFVAIAGIRRHGTAERPALVDGARSITNWLRVSRLIEPREQIEKLENWKCKK